MNLAHAYTPEDFVICNTCNSAASYDIEARARGPGNVIIINLEMREAKAFHVRLNGRPRDPNVNDLIAIPQLLPSDVMPAIDGYFELKAAFENHQRSVGINSMLLQFGGKIESSVLAQHMNQYTPFSAANGCGSPSEPWSYALIPDFPFKDACDAHDVCYTTNRSKTSCDQEFLENMRRKAIEESFGRWWSSPAGQFLFTVAVHAQAQIYYQAVQTSPTATSAYCNSTQNSQAAECAPNAPLTGGAFEGFESGAYPRYGGGTLYQSCELWSFPDGNGGRYLLERNCTFWMIP